MAPQYVGEKSLLLEHRVLLSVTPRSYCKLGLIYFISASEGNNMKGLLKVSYRSPLRSLIN